LVLRGIPELLVFAWCPEKLGRTHYRIPVHTAASLSIIGVPGIALATITSLFLALSQGVFLSPIQRHVSKPLARNTP
jgi:hypothetical protein